jgi:hypothetical protein
MKKEAKPESDKTTKTDKTSSLVDTRVIYCGDNLEQLKKLSDGYIDLDSFIIRTKIAPS